MRDAHARKGDARRTRGRRSFARRNRLGPGHSRADPSTRANARRALLNHSLSWRRERETPAAWMRVYRRMYVAGSAPRGDRRSRAWMPPVARVRGHRARARHAPNVGLGKLRHDADKRLEHVKLVRGRLPRLGPIG